ncbi:MAG: membrane protein insertion efficiency factor YidD [Chlamydiae bacterium RIFCSPHIGHO2_12_FULL_27_8]|nr:MAG: membrane protein insertion efficiency factor YidD [Chlamydiae bacterium RIFCSPHIGHO2_12_FULL_27_8]
MKKIFIILIRTYQLVLSPHLRDNCRFTPTCSEYSLQAFKRFGIIKALFLTIKRIFKCNPFHKGGEDKIV